MQLILAGGGAPDSKPLDELLLNLMPADKKLLYIPIAWKTGDFESCRAWFESAFSNLGFANYEMWTDLAHKSFDELKKFGGIYIGGGNTYSLLNDLRNSGFDKILLEFVASGRPIYGASAGAIIFGKTIDTAALGDDADENSVGLADTNGFNLVGDSAIQCHYKENQDEQVSMFVNKNNIPVIALGKRSGLFVENNKITVVGFEPAYLFNKEGKREYTVNSRLA